MIKKIFNELNGSNRKLKCLTTVTHESYESNLSKTNHEFYAFCKINGLKPYWNEQYRSIPKNYTVLDPKHFEPQDIEFDFCLSQQKFGSYQTLLPIAKQRNIPIISLEHTLPSWNSWPVQQRQQLKQMRGDLNVFISEHSIEQWDFDKNDPSVRVIRHCVDSDLFWPFIPTEERQNIILTVGNDFINRGHLLGFNLWNNVTNNLPRTVVGDTAGLSSPAISAEDLALKYNNCRIYINPSLWSPIPCSLLEAAACGLAIISTDNCLIPEIFTHGHDALLTNDEKEMRGFCEDLLRDEELTKTLAKNARQTILKKCSTSRFVEEWKNLFQELI